VIETVELADLPVVIGFSGDKVSTTNLIERVAERKSKNPEQVEGIFKQIEKLARKAKDLLLEREWAQLGYLLNQNQDLLDSLGVSTPQLSKQIIAAREAGAFGAKLSGAGGGDCMFALVDPLKKQLISQEITLKFSNLDRI
jgi:mevalonate kinase